jgi:hypothetical protein
MRLAKLTCYLAVIFGSTQCVASPCDYISKVPPACSPNCSSAVMLSWGARVSACMDAHPEFFGRRPWSQSVASSERRKQSKQARSNEASTKTLQANQSQKQVMHAPNKISSDTPPPSPRFDEKTVDTNDRRIALVIGNSKYQRVPVLPNPARDAHWWPIRLS